ncbi:prefoldin subunit alpha [Candidatus Nitrosocosmicus sp. SS]|uniref:prefoldin subunit alpha n=1 Tax=Candidatus Nitrosocosmicus agrestis TaxID=2563600 RepID=UPI00133182DF|nr:prefoldin subunit alpha [Candidatus Nitrosocosmicus sp. SS]MDR4492156.1 prefoldin subunit alpha [Candidatus Nitrosocosmicus sp.]
MNSIEQTVNDLMQESKLLEAYYNDIISKESVLHRLFEESHNSLEALSGLSSESDTLSLVPVGIGVFVKSSIYPLGRVLVNIGAGVVVEKKKEDAINFVEQRIKEFELATKQLAAQKQQISQRMMDIQNTVNSYMNQMQRGGPNLNSQSHDHESSLHSHTH